MCRRAEISYVPHTRGWRGGWFERSAALSGPIGSPGRSLSGAQGQRAGGLFNACYSEAQAKAIVEHIDYVFGMSAPENRQILADRVAAGMARAWEATMRTPITVADLGWEPEAVALPPCTSTRGDCSPPSRTGGRRSARGPRRQTTWPVSAGARRAIRSTSPASASDPPECCTCRASYSSSTSSPPRR
jgi:hypothetical protein